ncbi:MAG: amidohydrolase [Candidatus Tectomicrobia bacterium]|nr:amidohydrolase [Candidatus Tectomicrobia bacterium]
MPKEKVDLLFKNAVVVTMNQKREVFWDGAVAVREKKVVDVGPSDSLTRKYEGRREVEAKQKLIIPGLVNTHNHMFGALCRGLVNDLSFTPWVQKKFYLTTKGHDLETYYLSTLLLGIEMLKTGTTCYVDCGTMQRLEASAVRAIDQIGIKAVLGRTMADVTETLSSHLFHRKETTQENLENTERFVQEYHGAADDRVQAWFCPIQVSSVSDELCRGAIQLAEKHGSGFVTHAAVDKADVELCWERFHQTPIERFHRLGVLSPRLIATHMGWLTENEIRLLAESRSNISHCPSASMKGAYGCLSHGKFPELEAAGANVTLGTDGPAASNFQDMFRVMHLAAVGHKEARLDPRVVPPEKALEWATRNGARAVGWEDRIGSLEKGKRADMAVLNLRRTEFVPLHPDSLIPNLIYAAAGHCVETVLVDGKVLVEGGRVTTVDEGEIIDQINRYADRFADLSREWDQKKAEGKH